MLLTIVLYIIKIGLLLGLIKALYNTSKPVTISIIYTISISLFSLILGISLESVLILAPLYLFLSMGYYAALDNLHGRPVIQIIIAVLGILIVPLEILYQIVIGLFVYLGS